MKRNDSCSLFTLLVKIKFQNIRFRYLVKNVSVTTPQTAQLPPYVSVHSSHACGRQVTWADWFLIPCTTDGLVTGCKHERVPICVMTSLSYLRFKSNLVCRNPLTKVKVEALSHPWDFLSGFRFTFTSLCCARPYMLL